MEKMGKDDRGVERGNCQIEGCDCAEFVTSDGLSCGYCGDPPAKHSNLTICEKSNTVTKGKSVQQSSDASNKWMNKKFGWIPNPKRKTGKFYNDVLECLYKSYWPVCGGSVSVFRNEFINERNRQFKHTISLEDYESKLAYMTSENNACAGMYLKSTYFPMPNDVENIERLINNAKTLEMKVICELEVIRNDDDTLFCKTGRLKSGRDCHHSFNEKTIHEFELFIADKVKPLIQELSEIKRKCTSFCWRSKGRKRNDKQRKRENEWKISSRSKKRKLNRCCEIYQILGGELAADCFTPEMGAYQITEIEIESIDLLSDEQGQISKFDRECLEYMMKEDCFRERALDIVESYL